MHMDGKAKSSQRELNFQIVTGPEVENQWHYAECKYSCLITKDFNFNYNNK